MTKEIKLRAKSRSEKDGKVKEIRNKGFIPAVIYSLGMDSRNLKVKKIDFDHAFNLAGESNLINLTINDEAPAKVLVYGLQKDPIKDKIIHIDFYQVDMSKKITTEIPLNFVGEIKIIKEQGGTLVKSMDKIEVECLPGDLVSKIDIDLLKLETFHDVIKVSDLKLPAGIITTADESKIVASVIEPKKAEEEVKEEEEAVAGEEKKEGEEEAKAETEENKKEKRDKQ